MLFRERERLSRASRDARSDKLLACRLLPKQAGSLPLRPFHSAEAQDRDFRPDAEAEMDRAAADAAVHIEIRILEAIHSCGEAAGTAAEEDAAQAGPVDLSAVRVAR